MKDIKIRSISLKSFKGFDDITIDCAKSDTELYQWTVLLGNNNTGKTRILQAIADMCPITLDGSGNSSLNKHLIVPFISLKEMENWDENNRFDLVCNLTNYGEWKFAKYEKHVSADGAGKLDDFHMFAYGVSRYPSTKQNLSGEDECGDCDSLFSVDKRLIHIEQWLMQLDYSAKNKNTQAKKILKKIKEVICSNIFPEINDFMFESSEVGRNNVLFKTKDGWFRFKELGFGYQSMLSWVVDLTKRMYKYFPNSENPLLESAIVLVDEIDLHLHPKWQREIISYVSEIFKNVQFIVTTHSPLIIQSMQEVNLYVLRREDEKIVVEHSPETNFSGWTVEEILRDTMKLDNDIHSDFLQNTYKLFDEGLDNNDINKAREAYNTLIKILHPNNPARRLLKLQLDQMEIND